MDLKEAVASGPTQPPPETEGEQLPPDEVEDLAREAVRRLGVEPDPELVLTRDPRSMGIVDAVRYILSIPTNILMIISSSLGYFYFAGLSTFALLFVRGHYHASQAEAELVLALLVSGALAGTLVSGRITDQLLRRGVIEVRVWVPALCYLGAAALLIPGILGSHLTPAVWFDVAGASLLSAANPPLDAARLDIMPAGLWGRAESTRTVLRSLAQALAPLVFGGLADLIAGIAPEQAPIGTHPGVISPGAARGLEISFLLLLGTLGAGGRVPVARPAHVSARRGDRRGVASGLGRSRHRASGLGLNQLVIERIVHELGARPQPQLLLDVRAVGLDRAHRQIQLGGDLGVGVAEADHPQDVDLALGQAVGRSRRRLGGDSRSQPWVQVRVAHGRPAHRFDELCLGRLLEDVAERAGAERLARVRRLVLHREHDDLGIRGFGPDRRDVLEARPARQI